MRDARISPGWAVLRCAVRCGLRCRRCRPRELDLAGVESDADVERGPVTASGRGRATNRASGTVECCEDAVAHRLHLMAWEPYPLGVHDGSWAEHLTPMSVADAGHVVGRVDNVGEHDRGEHTIGVDRCVAVGDKVGDRVEQWAGITHEEQGVLTSKQDRVGARDVGAT